MTFPYGLDVPTLSLYHTCLPCLLTT